MNSHTDKCHIPESTEPVYRKEFNPAQSIAFSVKGFACIYPVG